MTVTININRRAALLLLVLATAIVLSILAAGCSNKQQQQFNDAPRSSINNTAPADIIAFPDGFNNVSDKCDGPNRVYVVFHNDSSYGSVAVVPNDPRCTDTPR